MLLDKEMLQDAVNYAFQKIDKNIISKEEIEKQKKIMFKKINNNKIKTPDDVMVFFDKLNKKDL